MHSCLYNGWVRHRRHAPRAARVPLPVCLLYLDLAELPQACSTGAGSGRRARPALARWHRARPPRRSATATSTRLRSASWCASAPAPPADGPDPAADAPALLRLRLQPGELLLLLRCGGPRRRGHRRRDQQHAVGRAALLRAAGGRQQRHAGEAAVPASARTSTSRRSCRWTWTTTGASAAPGERAAVHMENWRDGAAVFDATMTLRTRADIGRARSPARSPRHPLRDRSRSTAAIYWQALRLLAQAHAVLHPSRQDRRRPPPAATDASRDSPP